MDGIRSSFPPLDPNGQPFSMILRGAAAELGELRYTLLSNPNAIELLQKMLMMDEATTEEEVNDVDKFDDVEETTSDQQHQILEHTVNGGGTTEMTEDKKRGRDCNDDNDEGSDNDEFFDQEQMLLYVPSITCTCSLWKMKDVAGKILVTSIRVLFLPNDDQIMEGNVSINDVAIDGRCIALHAVDSVSSSSTDEQNDEVPGLSQQHVYCQLIESSGDEDDMGFSSTMSMVVPSKVVDEKHDTSTDEDEKYNEAADAEVDEDSDKDGNEGAIEVYFKPIMSDDDGKEGEDGNLVCERIFNSLTKLASLNPAGDFSDDECNGGGSGGFFNMLSLMAGMDGNDNDNNDDEDDEMVFRLGGSNNFVENDEEDSEIMASDTERQAMLRDLTICLLCQQNMKFLHQMKIMVSMMMQMKMTRLMKRIRKYFKTT